MREVPQRLASPSEETPLKKKKKKKSDKCINHFIQLSIKDLSWGGGPKVWRFPVIV